MSSTRQVLTFMPMRGGLATAGKRSTIDEGQLWKCTNMYPDLDGMLLSRPGLIQWGQTLTTPATSPSLANSFHELFKDMNSWTVVNATAANTYSTNLGRLTISMAATTTSSFLMSRSVNNDSTSTNYALKFTLRMTNPEGVDTTGGQLKVRVSGNSGTLVHELVFNADGIYVTGIVAPVYVPEFKLDLGGPHAYEIYYTASGTLMRIGFDGTVGAAFSVASATNVGFTGACNTVEIQATLDAAESAWTATLTDLQYTDAKVYSTTDPPFVGAPVVDVGQYIRLLEGGLKKSVLLAATGSQLYVDQGNIGAWQPILDITAGHTFFLPFQDRLLIFDDNGQNKSRVYEWRGVSAPTQVADAPPVQFGAVHRTRLWAAGDRAFPLRAYFTASRQSDVWFAPEYDSNETYDEVINAGYIVIPAETGDEITGIYGEYFGSLIIVTSKGLWRVTGSSPASFQVENISKLIGGASPTGLVQLGNDLHGVGKAGVFTAQSAATTGEFQAALPSGAIADKWSSIPSIANRVDRQQLRHSYFVALPSLNIAVLGMRGQGSTTLDQTMVYSPLLQQWYGPWTNNATCFTQVDIGTPEVEILLEGHDDGRVAVTGLNAITDMGSTYTCTLASPMFNGRTLDQGLIDRRKTWRTLRLYLLPRYNRDIDVEWWVDNEDSQSRTVKQDAEDGPSLSDDFILDVDILSSEDTIELTDVTLDAKGTYLHFEISSDYPLALQGYQLEFMQGD